MRTFFLLTILLSLPALALSAEPPIKEAKTTVRPALWWSDLNRFSDGGGEGVKPKTSLLTTTAELTKVWVEMKLKGELPKVNFKDYFVVVVLRVSGVDFDNGGLATNDKGEAQVVGLPAHHIVTNAGWWSTTIGIFPRKGIVSVEGVKLPALE